MLLHRQKNLRHSYFRDRKVNRNALSLSTKLTVTFISNWQVEKAITMGLRDFLTQCARTLKLAIKPGRSELWLSIKICMLGISAIGAIGFVVKLLSSLLQPGTSAA